MPVLQCDCISGPVHAWPPYNYLEARGNQSWPVFNQPDHLEVLSRSYLLVAMSHFFFFLKKTNSYDIVTSHTSGLNFVPWLHDTLYVSMYHVYRFMVTEASHALSSFLLPMFSFTNYRTKFLTLIPNALSLLKKHISDWTAMWCRSCNDKSCWWNAMLILSSSRDDHATCQYPLLGGTT